MGASVSHLRYTQPVLSKAVRRFLVAKLPAHAIEFPTAGISKRWKQRQNRSDIVLAAQIFLWAGVGFVAVVSARETILERAGGWGPHMRAGIYGGKKEFPRCGEKGGGLG